jgi:hypothetical protein
MIFGNASGVTCCKDCKERYLGCHDKCEVYIHAKEEYEERKRAYGEYKKDLRGTSIKKGDFLGDGGQSKIRNGYRRSKKKKDF